MPTKRALFEELIDKIRHLIREADERRQDAQVESNRHVGRMESRYDTFKEEAQYLADDYARQIVVLKDGLDKLLALKNGSSESLGSINIGTMFTVHFAEVNRKYLLVPIGGGITLSGGYIAITPESDLGKGVLGKKEGDSFVLPGRSSENVFTISSIL